MSSPNPPSPTTFLEFAKSFPDEQACIAYLARWRWPDGFVCPRCDHRAATRLQTRPLWQCHGCRRQTSVTAGTALHRTKLPLRTWLYALWLFGGRHTSISALQLQRETGIGSYETAWSLLHKVRCVLGESDDYPLKRGIVEVDETSWGGGGRNKGRKLDPAASWLQVAVERIEMTKVNQRTGQTRTFHASGSARVRVAKRIDTKTSSDFVERTVAEGATVATDQFAAYRLLTSRGFVHHSERCSKKWSHHVEHHLPKVHLLFSNFKTWLRGTFHGISDQYVDRYLDEFVYRFNRRSYGFQLFGFLTRRVMRAAHTPIRDIRGRPAEAIG